MKKRSLIPRSAIVLAGLLAIAAALILLARREDVANPASDSFAPSGTHAFIELLKKQGYSVRKTTSIAKQPNPDELVLGFARTGWQFDDYGSEVDSLQRWSQTHRESGGAAILFGVPDDFRTASLAATKSNQSAFSTFWPEVTLSQPDQDSYAARSRYLSSVENDLDLYFVQDTSIAWIDKSGKSRTVVVASGLVATNRFIDRFDNADFVVRLVHFAAAGRKKILVQEAFHQGAQEPGLMELIGPGAEGAWKQVLLIFVAMIGLLGVRFGLADERRLHQRSLRELVDAFADVMARSQSTGLALERVATNCDRLVRKRLKIASDTPNEVRDRLIPDRLAAKFYAAEVALKETPPANIAIGIARGLDLETRNFLQTGDLGSASGRRKRKRV